MLSLPVRAFFVSLLLAGLAGCAAYYGYRLDRQYGAADPARFDRPTVAHAEIDFVRDVKPILDNRCVVCHGCYDAPCQLNLSAYQGVTRGAHRDVVYNSARLAAAEPTRLFTDAESNAAWRAKGFYPVLNERNPEPEANRDGSVLYRALMLKRVHDLPPGERLPDKEFDFRLDRNQVCPSIEQMDRFEEARPLWGMPYGLPALSAREHDTLARWIETGAPYRGPAPLPAAHAQRVQQEESRENSEHPDQTNSSNSSAARGAPRSPGRSRRPISSP